MPPKTQAPGSLDYFTALQQILKLQTDTLTKVLPHSGERGSNTEEYFRQFLRRTLPHRYSIGTSFMICSTSNVEPSFQTDIVIFDEFHNSPLFRELAASVFPIETVYATIEVKGILQSKDIKQCVEASARVRRLAKEKRYIEYGYKEQPGTNKRVLTLGERRDAHAPRTLRTQHFSRLMIGFCRVNTSRVLRFPSGSSILPIGIVQVGTLKGKEGTVP